MGMQMRSPPKMNADPNVKSQFETIHEESEPLQGQFNSQQPSQQHSQNPPHQSIAKYDKQEEAKHSHTQSDIRFKPTTGSKWKNIQNRPKLPSETQGNPRNAMSSFNNNNITFGNSGMPHNRHSFSQVYPGFNPNNSGFSSRFPPESIIRVDSNTSRMSQQSDFGGNSLLSGIPEKKTILNTVIQEEDPKSVVLVSDIKQLYLQQIKDTLEAIKKDPKISAVDKLHQMQNIMKEFNNLIKEI